MLIYNFFFVWLLNDNKYCGHYNTVKVPSGPEIVVLALHLLKFSVCTRISEIVSCLMVRVFFSLFLSGWFSFGSESLSQLNPAKCMLEPVKTEFMIW